MKYNLYPIEGLPAYKDYFNFVNFGEESSELKNSILMVDCEMVMSS